MGERCKDLPDECWELIFNRLNHHSHFQPLISVSKRFFNIIRTLHVTLNLTPPAASAYVFDLAPLLATFPNINYVSIAGTRDPMRSRLLDQIASSSALKLVSLDISDGCSLPITPLRFQMLGQNMKCLRILKCSKMLMFSDKNLAVIANCLPQVEELDISYPQCFISQELHQGMMLEDSNVTDDGIEKFSLKLKGLKKINISGNHFLTDRSLFALSSNCALLREIAVRRCSLITVCGIQLLLKKCLDLESLLVGDIDYRPPVLWDCLTNARCLSTLELDWCVISDRFLYSLAMSHVPLKRFSLALCEGFTYDGVASFLHKHRSLEYLELVDVDFFNDRCVLELSKNLCKLTTIKLISCAITELTFFELPKICPLLEDINLGNNKGIGRGGNRSDIVKSSRIKSLNLSQNPNLSDECLAKIASVCPFLQILDVSFCSNITEQGIASTLNRCSYISHLEINHCEGVKNIGEGIELPKLEVLRAAKSGINGEGLAMIGKRCSELLNLDLEGCLRVTTKGLKEMLVGCRRLREINLDLCVNLDVEIVHRLVFFGPSLRRIIPPSPSFFDTDTVVFYFLHGCYVRTPRADGYFNNEDKKIRKMEELEDQAYEDYRMYMKESLGEDF